MSVTGSAVANVDSILAQPGQGMAAHDRVISQVEQDEYEYGNVPACGEDGKDGSNELSSYESLPPNFSLAANMAAGAFAGIAVGWDEGG